MEQQAKDLMSREAVSLQCPLYNRQQAEELREAVRQSRLDNATCNGDVRTVKSLLAHRADPNHPDCFLLHTACKKGNLEIVKALVEAGADTERKNALGRSPVHYAASYGHKKVLVYLIKDCKCSADIRDHINDTPLHHACSNGHQDVVQYLVEKAHCDINATNMYNNTPLDKAKERGAKERGYKDIVNYLKTRQESSPGQPGKYGVTGVGSRPAVPLTQDEADALQKLLEGAQVTIGHPIVADTTTLEEVQQLLTQRGLDGMAGNLRTRLRQILAVQQRNLEILDSLMMSTNSITLCYLKLFLVGPPFVGKTTTLNRLLKYFKNIHLEPDKAKLRSTLLANCLQVFALVSNDGTEWLSSKGLNEEVALLFRYFCGSDLKSLGKSAFKSLGNTGPKFVGNKESKIVGNSESNSDSEFVANSDSENLVGDDTTDERLARVRHYISRLQNVIKDKDESKELFKHIEDSTLLNINDIGGQPGFLEMLPALSNGPAMYLVFADLSKELNKPYKIPFSRDDTTITPYDAMHSVESTVSQILSSIASIHRISQEPVPFKLDRSTAFGQQFEKLQEVRPMATLIGTHKDKLEEPVDQKISEFDSALTKVTFNYKKIIANPSPNRTIFAVDNFSGTDTEDIAPIRGFLSDIFEKQFKDSSIPIQPNWLWFSLILRREYCIAPMDDCVIIARDLGIKEDELQLCLWYLHHCTGTIMYYPNIPGKYFKGHVICTPQVVFDSISEFIVTSLRILHGDGVVIESERVELIKKGQFSIKSIEKYCNCPQVKEKLKESKLLPAKQLVKLLEYVHLLSPIVHTQSDKEEITYLMPAVLECASQEELANPPPPDTNNPEPLHITFSFGYVPTGVFCGLITRLVSQGPHGILGLTWKLVEDGVKRNCVAFHVDGVHKVTLLSHEKSYEIRVSREDPESSLHDLCAHAISVVLYFLKILYENLVPLIAFQCPCSNHKAERDVTNLCTISDGSKVRFLCKDSMKLVKLKPEQRIWLGKTKKVGEEAELEVLKFAEDGFSFHWTKEGSRRQIKTTDDRPNTLSFPTVKEEDFGHYQCEVKDAAAGKVLLTLYTALFKEETKEFSAERIEEPKSNDTKSIVKTPSSGPPANRVALQELMRRYKLTDEQLNREIVDSDTPVMALNFDDVEMYSTAMGLAIAEQADVKKVYHCEGTQAAMMKCLKIWKERDPFQASYRALLNIALRLEKGETADKICQQLTQHRTLD